MSDPQWWTTASGAIFEQGDLLFEFPVVRSHAVTAQPGGTMSVEADVEVVDVIVVTQTCDLQQSKVAQVLIARVVSWPAFVAAQFAAGNTAVRGSGYIDNLVRGNIPPITLLSERTKQPTLPWSVVDFRDLYTVDRQQLDQQVQHAGSRQRLRLLSPYREHFAQAFARYFMRVGLPHDAASFREAGKLIARDVTMNP